MINTALVGGAVLAAAAHAHQAAWHPSVFGFDYPLQNNWPYPNGEKAEYQSNALMNPLRFHDTLTVDKWFAHGMLDYPPPEGVFLNVESGGDLHLPNRAHGRFGFPHLEAAMTAEEWGYDGPGALHTVQNYGDAVNISLFGGSALAIAYTSDERAVKPEDFTVISVQWLSVWWRVTKYAIPAGLPKCPPGGCLCTWNWIHTAGNTRKEPHPVEWGGSEGYPYEIYNNLLRCHVTGETDDNNVVPKGAVPVECVDNTNDCISGPKQPLYLWQADGNNIPNDNKHGSPSYNWRWGFTNGAQKDAVVRRGQEASANGKGGEGLDPAQADLTRPDLAYNLNATITDGKGNLYGGGKVKSGGTSSTPPDSTGEPKAPETSTPPTAVLAVGGGEAAEANTDASGSGAQAPTNTKKPSGYAVKGEPHTGAAQENGGPQCSKKHRRSRLRF